MIGGCVMLIQEEVEIKTLFKESLLQDYSFIQVLFEDKVL